MNFQMIRIGPRPIMTVTEELPREVERECVGACMCVGVGVCECVIMYVTLSVSARERERESKKIH